MSRMTVTAALTTVERKFAEIATAERILERLCLQGKDRTVTYRIGVESIRTLRAEIDGLCEILDEGGLSLRMTRNGLRLAA
jgi:hypothetical protein